MALLIATIIILLIGIGAGLAGERAFKGIASYFQSQDNVKFSVDAMNIYVHVKQKTGSHIFKKRLTVNEIDDLISQLKAEKKRMI